MLCKCNMSLWITLTECYNVTRLAVGGKLSSVSRFAGALFSEKQNAKLSGEIFYPRDKGLFHIVERLLCFEVFHFMKGAILMKCILPFKSINYVMDVLGVFTWSTCAQFYPVSIAVLWKTNCLSLRCWFKHKCTVMMMILLFPWWETLNTFLSGMDVPRQGRHFNLSCHVQRIAVLFTAETKISAFKKTTKQWGHVFVCSLLMRSNDHLLRIRTVEINLWLWVCSTAVFHTLLWSSYSSLWGLAFSVAEIRKAFRWQTCLYGLRSDMGNSNDVRATWSWLTSDTRAFATHHPSVIRGQLNAVNHWEPLRYLKYSTFTKYKYFWLPPKNGSCNSTVPKSSMGSKN